MNPTNPMGGASMNRTVAYHTDTQPTPPTTTTCTLCRLQPARPGQRYCRGMSCNNATRLCHNCDKPFNPGAAGSGSKYCSAECKPYTIAPKRRPIECPACDTTFTPRNQGVINQLGICGDCWQQLRELGVSEAFRRHHVPVTRIMAFIADPTCPICKTDLMEVQRVKADRGKWRTNITVDHDHTCCPKSDSCGRCIRGIICRNCNNALGYIHDNPATALAIANYLQT